jgi:hypothetical protein
MAWELGQKLGWSGKSGSVGAVLSSSGSFLGEVAPTGAAFGAAAARDGLAKSLLRPGTRYKSQSVRVE